MIGQLQHETKGSPEEPNGSGSPDENILVGLTHIVCQDLVQN